MGHLSWYTGDANSNTYVQDFTPLVMTPPLPGADIALWPLIGKLADGTEVEKLEWVEEALTQITLELGEALDTTETEVTFAAGEIAAAGLRAGALLKNGTTKTNDEIILVSSVDSTTSATVVRDYGGFVSGSGGGTTGQTHTSGDDLEIIGYLNFQGSSVTRTDYFAKRNRSTAYNYYSIMDDWTQVTVEDLVRTYRGSSPDNWGYQLNGIKQRLDRQFERALWSSPQKAMSATERGSFGGLKWYATQTTGASGNSYITTSETFTYNVFDAGMEYLYNKGALDGGHNLVCLMPPAGVKFAARIDESAMRGEYLSETVRGMRCTKLMSSLTGEQVPLVPVRNMDSDGFMILNLNAVRIHFLEGLGLAVFNKDVGEGLDAFRAARLYSVMSLEFQRPTENNYFHTGVSYS